MIQRSIEAILQKDAAQFPVIVLLGPRQAGKTTLTQAAFPKYHYISLEHVGHRTLARTDPELFLKSIDNDYGVIIDEFQHVPDLLSFIQLDVDKKRRPGFFVLTGSQNFLLNQHISQSLAGRAGILKLLPFSILELEHSQNIPHSLEELVFKGSYPPLYSQITSTSRWYGSYIETYVERDVRQLVNVGNLALFEKFLGLCAGRIGQLLNVSSLANDSGINVNTVKNWLSILEASFLIFLLKPYYNNTGKRLIKSPKLYFYDTGLACSLLGIDSSKQLYQHYLRGGLFENLIISDLIKYYFNQGKKPHIYFWRDSHGNEIDCIIQKGTEYIPIELKSGQTVTSEYLSNLSYWYKITNTQPNGFAVYAGEKDFIYKEGKLISWRSFPTIFNSTKPL